MSNLKHIAIIMSAVLSVLGASNVAFASKSCSTSSISKKTADCLSKAADSTFQSNYKKYYGEQKSSLENSLYPQYSSDSNNTSTTNTYYSAPQQTQQVEAAPPTPNVNMNNVNNNNNQSNTGSIHWF